LPKLSEKDLMTHDVELLFSFFLLHYHKCFFLNQGW